MERARVAGATTASRAERPDHGYRGPMTELRSRALRFLLLGCLISCVSAFTWPAEWQLRVRTLTEARTVSERRDALRLLALPDVAPPAPAHALLQGALGDADPWVRIEALRVIATHWPTDPALPRAAREDPSPEVRIAALQALAAAAKLSLEASVSLLEDSDARVRAAALDAIDPRQLQDAPALLSRALDDPMPEIKLAAVRALVRWGAADALPLLERAARDPLPELRAAVLDAVTAIPRTLAQGLLDRAIEDDDELVLLAALRGYARLAVAPPTERLELLQRSPSPTLALAARAARARTAEVSAPGKSAAEPRWITLLAGTATARDGASRRALLIELERELPDGSASAAEPLLLWLPQIEPSLQTRVVRLLERTGASLDAHALVPLLSTRDVELRAAATRSFARVDPRAAERHVLSLLADPAPSVRSAAVFALGAVGDAPRIEALSNAIAAHSGDPRARLEALARATDQGVDGTRAAASLCRVLAPGSRSPDAAISALALRALAPYDDGCAREAVLQALETGSPRTRVAALRASIRDHSPAAQAARKRALDAHVPCVAATALVAAELAGDPLPTPWLLAQIGRTAWPVGPSAAFVLAGRSADEAASLGLSALGEAADPLTRANARTSASAPAPHALRPSALAAPSHSRGPRALSLSDGRVLPSCPDGSGSVAWRELELRAEGPAASEPYGAL